MLSRRGLTANGEPDPLPYQCDEQKNDEELQNERKQRRGAQRHWCDMVLVKATRESDGVVEYRLTLDPEDPQIVYLNNKYDPQYSRPPGSPRKKKRGKIYKNIYVNYPEFISPLPRHLLCTAKSKKKDDGKKKVSRKRKKS